jgi:hypothetical protein
MNGGQSQIMENFTGKGENLDPEQQGAFEGI